MRGRRRPFPRLRAVLAGRLVPLPATAVLLLPIALSAVVVGPPASAHDRASARAPAAVTVTVGAAAPSTTVAGITRPDLSPPATIPFTTRRPNAHFGRFWADISVGGFAVFLLIALVQLVLTRPGRRGRRTL